MSINQLILSEKNLFIVSWFNSLFVLFYLYAQNHWVVFFNGYYYYFESKTYKIQVFKQT